MTKRDRTSTARFRVARPFAAAASVAVFVLLTALHLVVEPQPVPAGEVGSGLPALTSVGGGR